jgi:hypothetical protein
VSTQGLTLDSHQAHAVAPQLSDEAWKRIAKIYVKDRGWADCKVGAVPPLFYPSYFSFLSLSELRSVFPLCNRELAASCDKPG